MFIAVATVRIILMILFSRARSRAISLIPRRRGPSLVINISIFTIINGHERYYFGVRGSARNAKRTRTERNGTGRIAVLCYELHYLFKTAVHYIVGSMENGNAAPPFVVPLPSPVRCALYQHKMLTRNRRK